MNSIDNQNTEVLEVKEKSKSETQSKVKEETKNKDNKKEMETYLNLEDNSGILECDLILMREKNKIIRFFEIGFSGVNPETNQPQSAKKVIETKEDFLKFKEFIAQLDWDNL